MSTLMYIYNRNGAAQPRLCLSGTCSWSLNYINLRLCRNGRRFLAANRSHEWHDDDLTKHTHFLFVLHYCQSALRQAGKICYSIIIVFGRAITYNIGVCRSTSVRSLNNFSNKDREREKRSRHDICCHRAGEWPLHQAGCVGQDCTDTGANYPVMLSPGHPHYLGRMGCPLQPGAAERGCVYTSRTSWIHFSLHSEVHTKHIENLGSGCTLTASCIASSAP